MIIFEDQLARIIEVLPQLTSGALSQKINFNWGTEDILVKYLTLNGKLSFPLVWLVEGMDNHDLKEPNVKRNAKLLFLYESQAPSEFNPYQHEYDFKQILQPIVDNFLIAIRSSQISDLVDARNVNTYRHKGYLANYTKDTVPKTRNVGTYICNAIQLDAEIVFRNVERCVPTIIFNN